MTRSEPRVVRTAAGDYELHLPKDQRRLLRRLPGELREVMESGHVATWRLFPDAHPDDPVMSSEFNDMVRADLLEGRREALETMEQTIDRTRLDGEQLYAWLTSINDLRLFLGTSLNVTEETYDGVPEEPPSPGMALYMYLGWLQEIVVRALAEDLPDSGDKAL